LQAISPGGGDAIDVLLNGRFAINRAVDGDLVALELLPEAEWKRPSNRSVEERVADDADLTDDASTQNPPQASSTAKRATPCGRVVGIIKRNWRAYAGSLDMESRRGDSYLFVPVARNLPYIRIRTSKAPHELESKRLVVQIDTWERTSRYPVGHYVKTLGDIGDRDAENEVIFIEHDVPVRPFGANVLACLPPEAGAWRLRPEEAAKRLDLRGTGRLICSIDPPGCEDIDDALHCMKLPNGNFECGVHIADVTHFVRPGTALDVEAGYRGTTVYLVDRRIDMLPRLLNADLCSLRPNVDRLAFSVFWEITPDAEILTEKTRFSKTVIHSDRAFSYGEAQSQMDDPSCVDELTQSVRMLNHIAKQLKAARVRKGALNLASPEVKFNLDTETNNPLDVGMYELKEANSLVEEFMLLANTTVGAKIEKDFPLLALLRRHPEPAPSQLEPIIKAASAAGFTIDPSTSKSIADSLDNAERPEDPYFNKALRILCTRCMQQAVYFCSGSLPQDQYRHYGLAADIYTHFTSPIRRYADVLVHRMLAVSLGVDPVPENTKTKELVSEIAEVINRRHHMAQMAGRASTELHTLYYFKDRVVSERGIIIRVRENGIVVLVPRFGIESMIFLVEHGSVGIAPVYDDQAQCVTVKGTTYRIFTWLQLEISVDKSQPHRPALQLKITGMGDSECTVEPECKRSKKA